MAHVGIPGAAPFIATGLFFAGTGAAVGAYALLRRRTEGIERPAGIGLGVVAVGCFCLATAAPLMVHATPTLERPTTTARLQIALPQPGTEISGNPATVHVLLRLHGGRIVPFSSLHLIPNEGHIHLSLDGRIVAMSTSLRVDIKTLPGRHTLRAEFVAVDHRPFQPRVVAVVTFEVRT